MDLLELLKGINYFSFVTAFAKWILILLVISGVILFLGAKFKLFTRKGKVANVLAKLYYAIIPIYFIVFAIKIAPIKNSQNELNKAIDNNKVVITEFAYDFLSSVVSDSILLQKTSVKELVNAYLDTQLNSQDSLSNSRELKFAGRFLAALKRKIEYSFLSRLVESKIINKSTGLVGINKKTGKSLYKTDMYNLFKEGEIIDVFKLELNKLFGRIYKSMFLIFGLGLLLPVFEIVLSKYLKY